MPDKNFESKIDLALSLIERSERSVIFSGAGISTPSGIPDFRSQGTGLWTKYDPMRVASLTTFQNEPEVFYDWLHPLAKGILQSKPNPAHQAIAELQEKGYIDAVITQNIDTFHSQAGSANVMHIHGSMGKYRCTHCENTILWDDQIMVNFVESKELPKCRECGYLLKPDITLFEEMLPMDAWQSAVDHSENCDLFIVVGSSLDVTPANHLPQIALTNHANLIINTMSSTFLDQKADLLLQYDVVKVWSAILQRITSNT